MKIGLISDTHGWLDPKIFHHFVKCNQVWHAGDIGDAALLPVLACFPHFKAVHGNIDDWDIRNIYPEFQEFQCEQLTIWIIHIAGIPPSYTPMLRKRLRQTIPDILVCGHSHILRVMRDTKHPPLLYLNPGAAGKHGHHQLRTLLRFDINHTQISNMEVIELGPRTEPIRPI